MKKRLLLFSALIATALLGFGGAWLLTVRVHSTSHPDAKTSTQRYFAQAVAGDYDATYAMLDSASRSAISPDDWQRQNQAALAGTGALKNAQIVASEPDGATEAFTTVRLSFENHDPLEVILRMVREDGAWHVHVSSARPPADTWEHVEP